MSPTLIYLLAAYVLLALLIYLVQEKFIFKPEKLPQDFAYKYDLPLKNFSFRWMKGYRLTDFIFIVPNPRDWFCIFMAIQKVSKAGLNMPGISIAISMM